MKCTMIWVIATALVISTLTSCNSAATTSIPGSVDLRAAYGTNPAPAQAQWPTTLPVDELQPWEKLDAAGHVIPGSSRNASAINQDSEFVAGVERYIEGGTAADNGEATSLSSAAGSLSWSMYRIPLGGDAPGVVTVDANVPAGKGYYVGLANYGTGAWAWHGPFGDNHVRLSTADTSGGADFTSALGSVFICVVAYDGEACDVIGVGVNPVDMGDKTAPPAPDTPTATAVDNGLELGWMPVIAGDLAGYRIYSSSQWFFDGAGQGVIVEDSLEGLTSHVLTDLDSKTYVRISAVDISGNESALSEVVSTEPLAEAPLEMHTTVSVPSGSLNDTIQISATGAASYDFDTNGDGTYDITGDTTGVAALDTSALGIIRPTVRGTSGSGTSVALGGVSVIISGNSRPVADASASPTTGDAPLDVSFSGSDSTDFDGTIVGGGWDFDGDGTYDVWSDNDTGFVTSADNTYDAPGVYNAKLRVVDDGGAWDVDPVAIVVNTPAGNVPPVAVLRGSQFTGNNSIDVEFSAEDSYDPDGSITDYEWDFDGNGVFNEPGAEEDSHGDANPDVQTYTAGPPVVVRLRVTDNEASTHTATFTVIVHGAGIQVVDSEGTVGRDDSLAVVNGRPAISYCDESNGDLKYVRASDAYGSNWGTPVVVDPGGNVGYYTSLAVVDGCPAISYYDASNQVLKFARATDESGDGWLMAPVVADAAYGVGWFTSLAVVNGMPAISYFDNTNQRLKYVRALNADGNSWGTPVVVDNAGNVGSFTSMAVVDGNPAISYYDISSYHLKYVRATDASGDSWLLAPQVVDTEGSVGDCTSLLVVDGNPAISYHGITDTALKYVRALNAVGGMWATPVTVDNAGAVGLHTSMALVGGKPAISYYSSSNGDVKYVRALNADGSSWDTPVAVDSAGNVGWYTSLTVVNGLPAISYYDSSNLDLKYAVLY